MGPYDHTLNEQDSDREHQAQVLTAFCAVKGWTFRLTPPLTCYDADLFAGSAKIALVEAKWRRIRMDLYIDYPMDAKKADEAIRIAGILPVFLVVCWRGRDAGYLELTKQVIKGAAKRPISTRRGDKDDPGYWFLISQFKTFPPPVASPSDPIARELTHAEYCAGCYEVEGGKIHPPWNGGPKC